MNHITEQMNKSREEFDKIFKCNCFFCAEKGHPFATTNVEMQSFLASAQLTLLQAVREEVGQFDVNSLGMNYNDGLTNGIAQERSRIRHILDKAITKARKNI